jgi:hypothetical protein
MAGSNQLKQRVAGHDQQQRRRIETWRWTRELDSADRVTEDGRYRVAERIHDTCDDRAEIEEWADPPHILKGKSGERSE